MLEITKKTSLLQCLTVKLALTVFTLFIVLIAPVTKAEKVIVIPLFSDGAQKISNVVTVAKSGGDFSDLSTAMESIEDASESKPYMIWVAPGHYVLDRALLMKPFVSIIGSGIKNTLVTGRVSGSIAAEAALLVAASDTELREFSLENSVIGGNLITGVYADSVIRFSMSGMAVRVNADDSKSATGIVQLKSWTTLENVEVSVGAIDEEAAESAVGIFSDGSGGTWSNLKARGIGRGVNGIGVHLIDSSPDIRASEIIGQGIGVLTSGNARPRIDNSKITAFTSAGIAITISNSRINIINTQVSGFVSDFPTTTQCWGVYNPLLEPVSC